MDGEMEYFYWNKSKKLTKNLSFLPMVGSEMFLDKGLERLKSFVTKSM